MMTYEELVQVFAYKMDEAFHSRMDLIKLSYLLMIEADVITKDPRTPILYPWKLILMQAQLDAYFSIKRSL